jgi:hypothetical protein
MDLLQIKLRSQQLEKQPLLKKAFVNILKTSCINKLTVSFLLLSHAFVKMRLFTACTSRYPYDRPK